MFYPDLNPSLDEIFRTETHSTDLSDEAEKMSNVTNVGSTYNQKQEGCLKNDDISKTLSSFYFLHKTLTLIPAAMFFQAFRLPNLK